MGAEQSSVGGLSTEEAERELELAALDKAARVAQAFFRGHLARKDCRLLRTKGELLMRTNLPAGWRAEDGVPAGLEIEERRHVSFIDNHLLVSRTHFGCFASAVSVADFVLHTTCVQRVRAARRACIRTRCLPSSRARSLFLHGMTRPSRQ